MYVRPSVHAKLNGATWSMVEWIEVDETNRTISVSRSSKVKVKVTRLSQFAKIDDFKIYPPPFSEISQIILVIHMIWANN